MLNLNFCDQIASAEQSVLSANGQKALRIHKIIGKTKLIKFCDCINRLNYYYFSKYYNNIII